MIDARERPGADRHASVESEDVEHAAKDRVAGGGGTRAPRPGRYRRMRWQMASKVARSRAVRVVGAK